MHYSIRNPEIKKPTKTFSVFVGIKISFISLWDEKGYWSDEIAQAAMLMGRLDYQNFLLYLW